MEELLKKLYDEENEKYKKRNYEVSKLLKINPKDLHLDYDDFKNVKKYVNTSLNFIDWFYLKEIQEDGEFETLTDLVRSIIIDYIKEKKEDYNLKFKFRWMKSIISMR